MLSNQSRLTGWRLVFLLTLLCLLFADTVSYSLPNAAWIQQAKLTASDAGIFDVFGQSVSVSGDTAVIGAPGDGSAYVFVRSSGGWSQQAKLTTNDSGVSEEFGFSVALVDDTAVIGAYLDDSSGVESGAVYVFVRDGSSWSQQAKLVADDASEGDRFGFQVALSEETAVIGTPWDDDSFNSSGSAYVFVRDGSSWSQQAKLNADDAAEGDEFGNAVAIDANTIVIGARKEDNNFSNDGSAYVFVREGLSWDQQAKIVADDADNADEFGSSVAIDGITAVIGTTGDDDGGDQSGSAYVFVRDVNTWSQQAKLNADDAANFDRFGNSVAVDGDSAVIGAWGDTITGYGNGSAYVFMREGSSWSQQAKLVASDTFTSDSFGQGVALDRKTVIIGSPGDDDADVNSGSAYVFAVPAEVSIDDVVLPEGDIGITNFQFTITRTDNIDALSIEFATNDGTATIADSDYVADSGTVSFAAGGLLTKQITIQVNTDTEFESDETFFVTLNNVVGNGTITDGQGLGMIENDDKEEKIYIFLPLVMNNSTAMPVLTATERDMAKGGGIR